MPLKGVRVIELAGLAPAPFCGMILSDFGAQVTVVDRSATASTDILRAGKRSLALNLKSAGGRQLFRRLCAVSDVLIEPFRPGVMERLSLGPAELLAANERLIYARLTGFGQSGPLAQRAGHDINYAAMSGVLSLLGGRTASGPTAPVNLLADMAGGGLMCALGITMALLERQRSGRGQIVDAAMVDGAAYVGSWLTRAQRALPAFFEGRRGENLLDGGRFFYDCYRTSDGRFMSVGAIEPQFFDEFVRTLGLPELQQFGDEQTNARARELVAERFGEKTQAEWTRVFCEVDACVFPVLEGEQAAQHELNRQRGVYLRRDETDGEEALVAAPAPRLSRTPAVSSADRRRRTMEDDWQQVLREIGCTDADVRRLHAEGDLLLPVGSKL